MMRVSCWPITVSAVSLLWKFLNRKKTSSAGQNINTILISFVQNGPADMAQVVYQQKRASASRKRARVDPSASENYTIVRAARNGNVDVVELLLKEPIGVELFISRAEDEE
ncbi:hypothetical protein PROFUN_10460 [Planoprotostelium fungivorum]|uniref:Ankyrin repeat protein n=1 Tax=Planoprotostelium fungivorum TaxID=1890364 RepID=A0A2P6NDC6_9EUKA|nr:hypothetical protein PROFUN_10460 [Planoprotostelium fungivorum]